MTKPTKTLYCLSCKKHTIFQLLDLINLAGGKRETWVCVECGTPAGA